MKNHRLLIALLISFLSGSIVACPTCIGIIEQNSPTFFSNDAYGMHNRGQENQTHHMSASVMMQEEE